jgi:hypothetical protein
MHGGNFGIQAGNFAMQGGNSGIHARNFAMQGESSPSQTGNFTMQSGMPNSSYRLEGSGSYGMNAGFGRGGGSMHGRPFARTDTMGGMTFEARNRAQGTNRSVGGFGRGGGRQSDANIPSLLHLNL